MTVAVTEKELPKVIDTALRFYDCLATEAVVDNGRDVYTGGIAEKYKTLGVSYTYYTKVMSLLEESGCIFFVQKGGRGRESIVVLLQKPNAKMLSDSLTRLGEAAKLAQSVQEQRLSDIEGRLQGFDFAEIFVDIEKRLKNLEAKLLGESSETGG